MLLEVGAGGSGNWRFYKGFSVRISRPAGTGILPQPLCWKKKKACKTH